MEKLNYYYFNALIKVAFIILLTFFLYKFGIFKIINKILMGLSPFFFGFFLAWVVRPLTTFQVNKLKVPSVVANFISILFTLVALLFIVFVIIPLSFAQITLLTSKFGEYIEIIFSNVRQMLTQINIDPVYTEQIFKALINNFSTISSSIINGFFESLGSILSLVTSITYFIIKLGIGYALAFLLVSDFGGKNKRMLGIIGKNNPRTIDFLSKLSTNLLEYIQGTILVSITVFIIIAIGTYLMGMQTPLLFALLTAILVVIPYIGLYIAAVPIVLVGFSISPFMGIMSISLIAFTQAIEALYFQPKIMSKSTHLHPITIMVGILLTNVLFGIIGMMFCIPLIIVVRQVIEFKGFDIKI